VLCCVVFYITIFDFVCFQFILARSDTAGTGSDSAATQDSKKVATISSGRIGNCIASSLFVIFALRRPTFVGRTKAKKNSASLNLFEKHFSLTNFLNVRSRCAATAQSKDGDQLKDPKVAAQRKVEKYFVATDDPIHTISQQVGVNF
jgi:hypothetical protein